MGKNWSTFVDAAVDDPYPFCIAAAMAAFAAAGLTWTCIKAVKSLRLEPAAIELLQREMPKICTQQSCNFPFAIEGNGLSVRVDTPVRFTRVLLNAGTPQEKQVVQASGDMSMAQTGGSSARASFQLTL